MRFLGIAFAFAFVTCVAGGLAVGLTSMGVSIWPIAALLIGVGWALSRIPAIDRAMPGLMLAYGSFFSAALVSTTWVPDVPRAIIAKQLTATALIVVGVLGVVHLLVSTEERSRKALPWLVGALALGVTIAYISGDKGSADPMRSVFFNWFSPRVTEWIVTIIRKAMHLTFYGTMAWLAYRGSKAAGSPLPWMALGVAVAHGAFDEYRQAFFASRQGSPIDVVVDAIGALLVLRWAGAFRKGKRPKSEGTNRATAP